MSYHQCTRWHWVLGSSCTETAENTA